MDYQEDTPPAGGGLWRYPDNVVVAGEADADDVNRLPAGMFNYSNDDLFDLVWQQGGGGGGVSEQAEVSSNLRRSPSPFRASALVHDPEVLPDAPFEEEMALWLSPIVRGEEEERASYGADGGNGMMMTTKDTASDSSQKEAAREVRRSHHGEIHNLTEKKRRCKINDRLKTLQQLVPGCDKSNHASTLEQTIQYMKWLQHQVQAMSVVSPPPPPAGVAPVVLGSVPVMLFRPLLPCAHYPEAPAMLAPAAASPLYPAPAPPDPARTAPATGSAAATHRHGSKAARSRRAKVAAAACDKSTTRKDLAAQEFHSARS